MGLNIGSCEIWFSFGRKALLIILGCVFCTAAASIYLYYHSPFEKNIFPQCIFRTYFDVYCPGCGATRATYELLHGDIIAAFKYNPLYVISIPFMMYLSVTLMGIKINGKKLLSEFNLSLKGAVVLIVIIFGYWILRNVPVYPFTLLRP